MTNTRQQYADGFLRGFQTGFQTGFDIAAEHDGKIENTAPKVIVNLVFDDGEGEEPASNKESKVKESPAKE